MRETQAQLENASALTELGFFTVELPSQALSGSPKFLEQFGLNSNSTLKMDEAINRIHPDDRMQVRRAIERTLQEGAALSCRIPRPARQRRNSMD